MNIRQTQRENDLSEVNLKFLIGKILKKKLLFAISILLCLAAAFTYLKIATPKYSIRTSLLIDPSGKSRSMSSSKYVDGEMRLFGMEKNLFNEIGILKSFDLINATLNDLDFEVSYYSGPWYKMKEYYNFFPFEVFLKDSTAQIRGIPFYVDIISDEEYRLSIKSRKFFVSSPSTNVKYDVTKKIDFSQVYHFGEEVTHDYFQFVIEKRDFEELKTEFEGKKLSFKINSKSHLVNSYLNKMEVEQLDIQASILTIKTEGGVVEKEVNYLNKLNDNFINSKYVERTEVAASKENFIQKQLKGITDSLSRAERRLANFKRGTNAVDLTRTGAIGLDQLQQLESEQGQIELNIKYFSSLFKYIDEQNGIQKVIAPSTVGIDDPLLNDNLLELKRLNSEINRLSFIKGKKSYDLQMLGMQIENTTEALKENLRNLISNSQIALSDKRQKISKLERSLNQLPGNEKRLLSYERKTNLYGNLFNYLSQELAKTNIASAENLADTRVLDEPRMMGTGPVTPQKLLVMTLGGILGFFFPLAWIVFAGPSDETIDNIDHLEERSSFPIAAKIFHAKKQIQSISDLSAQFPVKESFRDLGANLQFLVTDPEKNVIGITSSVTAEGKTFCASTLGLSLACEGKKILLVDLNFRDPKLWSSKVQKQGSELSGYLQREDIEVKDIIYTSAEHPNLHYIPTHANPENPHKFLSNDKLNPLLEGLKIFYDYIIIDSSPIGLVSDYLLISKYIDIHLFVLRRKLSKFSFLKDFEKLQVLGKMEHCFLIFNDCKNRQFKKRFSSIKNSQGKEKNSSPLKIFQKQKSQLDPIAKFQAGKR